MSEDLADGQLLANRFEILSLVGKGGMASVYVARDTVLSRTVAIKVFTVDTSDDYSRLQSEVRLLSGLNHPNLVTVHDAHIAANPADGPSYLVMEFVTGRTLRDANSQSPLSRPAIAAIASDIGEALGVVHASGIVHRDVKPANILIERNTLSATGLRAKLADFGIAHTVGSTRLTAAGMVVGTAGYLSPEQAEGLEVSPASDIYALGLVLLESLKGQMEYPGTVPESLAARISRDPVIPGSLPVEWSSLLGEMLARDPHARPTAVAVARRSALIEADGEADGEVGVEAWDSPTQLISTESTTTRVLPTAEPAEPAAREVRRRHPVRIALVVATVVILGVVAILLTQSALPRTAPVGSTPGASTSSSSPTATTLVTPTAPASGNANGNGKGNGKGHGHGNNH